MEKPGTFQLPKVYANRFGWGPEPGNEPEQFKDLPFCPFGKGDRLGKAADFVQTGYQRNPYRGRRGQYDDANKFVNEALLSGMPDVDDSKFTRVDSSTHRKPDRFRGRDRRRMQRGAGRFKDQKQLGGDNRGGYSHGGRNARGGNDFRRNHRMRIDRAPTVTVDASWKLIEEFNLAELKKLKVEAPKPDEVEDLEWCGALDTYNDEYDRLRARPKPLDFSEKVIFFFVNTVDDPKIRQFGAERKGNVYCTDAILSHLMASPRSVIPWDVVVEKNEFGIFLYKRNEDANIDLISVNENSPNPPLPRDDHDDPPNSAERLSGEATVINWKFSQQILKRGADAQRKEFESPHPFFEVDVAEEGSHPASVAYRYRRFPLGNHNLVVRTELHGLLKSKSSEEPLYMTAYALNEWEKDEWRRKIDQQPGAILTSEITNNGFKLHKWTAQSVLAGADIMKLGFVTRNPSRLNRDEHLVLSTQNVKPALFAKNMLGTSVENMWGIVKMIVDKFMREEVEEGKYIMVRDPNKAIVRIYNVPPDTFESDDDEDGDDEDDDDKGGEPGEGDYDGYGSDGGDDLSVVHEGGSIYNSQSRHHKRKAPGGPGPIPSPMPLGGGFSPRGFHAGVNGFGGAPIRGNRFLQGHPPKRPVTAFHAGPGLRNLGNTCYLNCILQVMIHCREIWSEIQRQPHRDVCRISPAFCVLCELEDLMQKARDHPQGDRAALEPNRIAKNIRKIAPHFSIDHQEDAHEFLRTFIDAMQRCCIEVPKNIDVCCKPYPFSLFAGSLVSKVECQECMKVSETVDPIEDLVLEIQHCYTVEDALKRFTADEVLDGGNLYKCERCEKRVKAVKRIGLREVPKVLGIQLKRFAHESFGKKLNKRIAFKETLALDPFIDGEPQGIVGQLFAVVVHSGHSVDAGHYYSYIKASNLYWYEMNDENVSRVDQDHVLQSEAYILFYIVKQTGAYRRPANADGMMMMRGAGPTGAGLGSSPASADKTPYPPPPPSALPNGALPMRPMIGPALPPGFRRSDEEKPPPTPFIGPQRPPDLSSGGMMSGSSSSSSRGLGANGSSRVPQPPSLPPPPPPSSPVYTLNLTLRGNEGGALGKGSPLRKRGAEEEDEDKGRRQAVGGQVVRTGDAGSESGYATGKKRKLVSMEEAESAVVGFMKSVMDKEPSLLSKVLQQLQGIAMGKISQAMAVSPTSSSMGTTTTAWDIDSVLQIIDEDDGQIEECTESLYQVMSSRVKQDLLSKLVPAIDQEGGE